MRHLIAVAVAIGGLTAPLAAVPPAALAAPGAASAARPAGTVKTPFLMGATALGTRVVGGDIPAQSDGTGQQFIGCQNLAGKNKSTALAETELAGLTVAGVRTRVWTDKVRGKVASHSLHTIARVGLLDTPLGSLDLTGLRSQSTAFNKAGKFGASTTSSVANIVLTPAGGKPVKLNIPAPGRTLKIPGLADITIGRTAKSVTGQGALARAVVLRIKVIPTNTTVVVGSTTARIDRTLTRGLFNGYGVGLQGAAVAGNVTVGRQAVKPLGCIGTDGKIETAKTAGLDLAPLITTGAATGAVRGGQNSKKATAATAGQVADVSLLDGQVKVGVVTGVVTVTRSKQTGRLTRSTKGTTVGDIEVGGQSASLDQLGNLEIPGVVRLQRNVVTRLENGIRTVGLRVTVLDGTGAVLDLGVAQAKIRPVKKG